jgi:hypothetical protein
MSHLFLSEPIMQVPEHLTLPPCGGRPGVRH